MNEDTSAYWRKLLELDYQSEAARKYRSPLRAIRPVFYFIFGIFSRLFFPIAAHGTENIPSPPYIISPNHQSFLDYLVMAYAMGKKGYDLYPVATKVYYDNPFERFFIIWAANAIRIDTEKDFFPALKAAGQILKSGHAVPVFPEGYCSTTGELLPFKMGAGILSVEINVPIVPVYIKGTSQILPFPIVSFKPGRISVYFGKPIDPGSYILKKRNTPAYDVYKELTEELRSRIIALRQLSAGQ